MNKDIVPTKPNTPPAAYAPIISTATDVPVIIRIRDIILTILLWIAYLYFMRDFFSFVGDAGTWASHGFVDSDGYSSFRVIPTILNYLLVTFIFGLIYILWAKYNQLRFRGKTRRRAIQPVTVEQMAKLYNIDPKSVTSWQKAHTLTMYHDARGYLTKVEIG
jgi:biofilm PGA synthesis protein PgaD